MEGHKKTTKVPGAKIQIEERPGYLYAFVSGPKDSVEISLKCAELICQEAERRGMRRILIEEDFPNRPTIAEIYEVCSNAASVFPLGVMIAHVDRNAEQHEINVFGEVVARNRGLVNRAFSSIEEAEEWLAKGITE